MRQKEIKHKIEIVLKGSEKGFILHLIINNIIHMILNVMLYIIMIMRSDISHLAEMFTIITISNLCTHIIFSHAHPLSPSFPDILSDMFAFDVYISYITVYLWEKKKKGSVQYSQISFYFFCIPQDI